MLAFPRWRPAALVLALLVPSPGLAATMYVNPNNPVGIPDLTQQVDPICAAAAAADLLWEWSAHAPFRLDNKLVKHDDPNDFAVNWPINSAVATSLLSFWIYGSRDGQQRRDRGYGASGGITWYLYLRESLFGNGVTRNPRGLSVVQYNDERATYATLKSLLDFSAGIESNVLTSWYWHLPDGGRVENGGVVSRHAMAAAGWDTSDGHLVFANPWGTHTQAGNPPVSTDYYDTLTIQLPNGANGPVRIPASAANNAVVRGIANADTADYMQMDRFLLIKQGGSPQVSLEVMEEGSGRRFEYAVFNPEPEPMFHFYLEIQTDTDGNGIADLDLAEVLATATMPAGWGAELWDPDATGDDLFGPQINCGPGSDCGYDWDPSWGGIHWSTSGNPILSSSEYFFSFLTGNTVPYVLDGAGLTVVGGLDNGVQYFNVTGGPGPARVPEPGTLGLASVALAGALLLALRAGSGVGAKMTGQ